MPDGLCSNRGCKIQPSSSSPTETTWTTSFTARSPAATNCCGKRQSRRQTARPAGTVAGFIRSRRVHHDPEVHATGEGDRYPQLSDRRNIIVIADEAHRSQYDFIDGFAGICEMRLPYASFIGFTGTPIEKTDANTRSVFGDYISIYDIQRAVEDKATVRSTTRAVWQSWICPMQKSRRSIPISRKPRKAKRSSARKS